MFFSQFIENIKIDSIICTNRAQINVQIKGNICDNEKNEEATCFFYAIYVLPTIVFN